MGPEDKVPHACRARRRTHSLHPPVRGSARGERRDDGGDAEGGTNARAERPEAAEPLPGVASRAPGLPHHRRDEGGDDLVAQLRAWESGGELRWTSHLRRGLYADHIEAWDRFFPRNPLLVLKSEDLFASPEEAYAEVLRFLGLPDHRPSRFKRHNFHGDWGEAPAGMAARLGRDLGWARG